MGSPDMAYYKFTQRIVHGEPIQIYNHGNMRCDLTYVEDIVEGVIRVMAASPADCGTGAVSCRYLVFERSEGKGSAARRCLLQ